MKKMLYTGLIVCTAITLFACKKKETTSFPLVGLWSGTWKEDSRQANPNNNFNLAFTSGSRLIVNFREGNDYKTIDTTYTNTDSIRFTYKDPISNSFYSNVCKYNSSSSTMNGRFNNLFISTDKGTFSVTKQ